MTDDLEKIIREIARKQIRFPIPGADEVVLKSNIAYGKPRAGELLANVYTPAGAKGTCPVVILVSGYPFPAHFPASALDKWGPLDSWARVLSGRGMACVTYSCADPAQDSLALLDYLGKNADDLGLDMGRVGLVACSGHGANAFWLIMEKREQIRCAVLNYAYLLDIGDAEDVANAAAEYGFANPCAGKGVEDLPAGVPLLLTRAGQDHFAGIKEGIDRFMARALALNLPVTLINLPNSVHGFDLEEESAESGAVIRQILAFLGDRLME